MTMPLMLWDNTDDEWFYMLYFNGTWLLQILEMEIHMAKLNLIVYLPLELPSWHFTAYRVFMLLPEFVSKILGKSL